jgi:peptidoglycan hydrolase-like protein with peptidoglycan-binding domain
MTPAIDRALVPPRHRRRRRTGLRAAALRLLRRHPFDAAAALLAAGLAIATIVNALALQPTPGMRRHHAAAAAPLPTPKPRAIAAAEPTAPANLGSPENLVEAIQTELKRRGIYQGATDGDLGARTQAAIRAYQIVAGLAPTGQPSPALLATLRDIGPAKAPPAAAAPDSASSAAPVQLTAAQLAEVQRVLARQGFGPLQADGVFGEATRAAIRRFEQSRGMAPRGEITPQVLRALSAMSGVALPGL